MAKDTKILFASLAFTFLLIVGASFLFSKGSEEEGVSLTDIQGVEIIPANYDLGKVPIDAGIVTKEYKVKNTTGDTLKLKKIATSCMCTQAKVKIGEKETRFFGMEHAMDKNPPVNLELPGGETAKVTVNFDPAAHGPQGKGPFERVIWLTFSDPAGIKELTFDGEVI